MTDNKIVIGKRTYWRHKTTLLWWSVDTAGHGGTAFKVYKEDGSGNLVWFRDADQYGGFINPQVKHKGKKGKYITYEIEEMGDDK